MVPALGLATCYIHAYSVHACRSRVSTQRVAGWSLSHWSLSSRIIASSRGLGAEGTKKKLVRLARGRRARLRRASTWTWARAGRVEVKSKTGVCSGSSNASLIRERVEVLAASPLALLVTDGPRRTQLSCRSPPTRAAAKRRGRSGRSTRCVCFGPSRFGGLQGIT